MGASLRDVAKLAGVSVKTVSNVVNDYEHVTEETRTRVQRALDELNYRPNVAARNLRKGRTGLIALVLPELDEPYFAELTRFVIKEAERHSWTVLIDQTDGERVREQVVLEGLRAPFIDGLIFSPLTIGAADLWGRRDPTPLVLLGERIYAGPMDHVAIDNVAAARTATEHLLSIGRRRVAAIGAQPVGDAGTAALRLRGYTEAVEAAGLAADPRLVMPAQAYRRGDGARAMRQLLALDDPPDAVFCFNDLLAIGALRTLYEEGLRVPGDVALVGFDDIEEARFATPTLTTVAPDKRQLARRAVELLAERLDARDGARPREVQAGFSLAVRESTQPSGG